MKPTAADIEALAAAMAKHEGIAEGAYACHRDAAAIAWDFIAPLVLERAARECDEVAAGHVFELRREAVEEMAEYIRLLKDEK